LPDSTASPGPLLPPAPQEWWTAPAEPPPPVRSESRSFLLAAGLFLLSLFTCVTLGGGFLLAARTDVITDLVPLLLPETVQRVWTDPELLRWGFAFALPVLAILLAHEMGHYLYCRHYGLPATPPYFLPAPLGLGTFGAFIRIRGAIRSKRVLFDVGVAGPIAGFVALLPFLVYGVAHSAPATVQRVPESSAAMFLYLPGKSLLYQALVRFFHGPLPADVILNPHPFALAAWVGCFATMLNLLPLAQLDGGHLLFAVVGRRQFRVARLLWLVLLAGGFVWPGWFLWSLIVLVMGLRHPPVVDEAEPLDRRRRWLAVAALAIFVLCFMPVPISSIAIALP
jgi:membrane-associated protease RseP (regulator of RpoE activity)